jgi:hypothetical protein
MLEERTSFTDYATSINIVTEFYTKYPTVKVWIENLCLLAIIKAYEAIKEKRVRNLSENQIRNLIIKEFEKNQTNPIFIDNLTNYVPELQMDYEYGQIIRGIRKDIVFFVGKMQISDYVFVVECKQFDAYDLSYVKGENNKDGVYIENGVERFVKAVYVRQQDKYAGMLGFYKNDTPAELITNLQIKIKKYFPKTDFPNFQPKQFSHHPHSFLSYHPREDETEITVYHCILPI